MEKNKNSDTIFLSLLFWSFSGSQYCVAKLDIFFCRRHLSLSSSSKTQQIPMSNKKPYLISVDIFFFFFLSLFIFFIFFSSSSSSPSSSSSFYYISTGGNISMGIKSRDANINGIKNNTGKSDNMMYIMTRVCFGSLQSISMTSGLISP